MTRRNFWQLLMMLPLAGAAIRVNASHHYGYMDVERWHRDGHFGKRVLLDGVDITDRCKVFHDVEGWAECYQTHPPRIDPENPDCALIEYLTGTIAVTGTPL